MCAGIVSFYKWINKHGISARRMERCPSDSVERFTAALMNSQVEARLGQEIEEEELFTIKSRLI